MLLENKNAIIYGAGGAIGGAVARAFAHEGVKVCLAGHTLANLDAVARGNRRRRGTAKTEGSCQCVRGLLARGKPLKHHAIHKAMRSDEEHRTTGPLPTGGHPADWCAPPAVGTPGEEGVPSQILVWRRFGMY